MKMVSKSFFAKKLSIVLLAFIVTTALYALPAVVSPIADTSGEYVFYRDNTFTRPSYIGFIYYDDATYAVRYYAPAVAEQFLPEKDITLYLTVNKDSAHLEFTGETMKGVVSDADTDVVNYMHDLFYELTARRQKATITSWQDTVINDDFAQFGGTVKMTYTTLIPLFNLYSISAPDGKLLLQTQTTGLLSNSDDKNFTSFKGLDNLKKNSSSTFAVNEKAKTKTVTCDGIKISLPEEWTQAADNVWYLDDGNTAILSIDKITIGAEDATNFYATLLRKACESVEDSFVVWQRNLISVNKKITKIANVYYQPSIGFSSRDLIVIKKLNNTTFGFYKLTTNETTYEKYTKYFEKIMDSAK